jgi:hypothetical protein
MGDLRVDEAYAAAVELLVLIGFLRLHGKDRPEFIFGWIV